MRYLCVMISVAYSVLSTQAHARALNAQEITALLPTIVAKGSQTSQIFSAAGATTYTDRGRASFGNWRVQNDQYCSQWPPAGGWSCYRVDYDEDTGVLIWIDSAGNQLVNKAAPKN